MEGVRGLEIGRTRANARVEENIGYYYEQTENQLVGAGTNIAQLKFPVGLFLRLSYDRLKFSTHFLSQGFSAENLA
jgi:hypothetical protein